MLRTSTYAAGILVFSLALAGCQPQATPSGGDLTTPTSNETKATPEATTPVALNDEAPLTAVAVFVPVGDSGVQGVVTFTRDGDVIHVEGEVTGLTPGLHAFHIHEFGDVCNTEDGSSAGGHFNPDGKDHGHPDDDNRHVGDLGNIEADENGTAQIDIEDSVIALSGSHNIIGRTVVIHQGEDQFTQPVGDAGARVAIGVIGLSSGSGE